MTTVGHAPALLETAFPVASSRRQFIQGVLGPGKPPLIVASMSRSASTVLYRAIAEGWARARFGALGPHLQPLICDNAWRLDETPLIGGVVYKTHDLPERLPRETGAKVVFTYRRASEVAISIFARRQLKPKFFEEHRTHLGGSGGIRAFAKRDSLGLERQVDQWFAAEDLDMLGIRYDQLWDRLPDIEAFLGFRVPLKPFRAGKPHDLPDEVIANLRKVYHRLDRKIEAMPAMFTRSAPDRRSKVGI